jgi:urease accessory protein
VFGRHGSGERFCTGQFDQRVGISLDGTEIWIDRLRLAGNDDLFDSPIGMAGHHALSTFWAIAPEAEPFTDELVLGIRQAISDMVFTRLHPQLLVGRALGAPIGLHATLKKARAWIRQHAWLSEASDLRLWAT